MSPLENIPWERLLWDATRDDAPDPLYSGWHVREVFVSPGFLTIEAPGRC